MSVIEVCLWERGDSRWEATIHGKSAPILQPVPGNTRPSRAATWTSQEEACDGLRKLLGADVLVQHIYWRERAAIA